jgi:hypothetical protein
LPCGKCPYQGRESAIATTGLTLRCDAMRNPVGFRNCP